MKGDKVYRHGTHRTRTPRETFELFSPLAAQCGITRIANLTGLDCIGVPVWVAYRPTSRSLATAQGKGLDDDSARVSALMESLETWHAEHLELPLRYESYIELSATANVVDVSVLPTCEEQSLDLVQPISWVKAYDLVQDQPIWLPLEMVTLDLACSNSPAFRMDSNGLASGNNLMEATVHALCEVIERDADTVSRLLKYSQRLDLSTIQDPCCTRILGQISDAGLILAAYDMTSDTGVPAYYCRLMEHSEKRTTRQVGVFAGMGCHLSPEIALLRAMTEAVQTRMTAISGARDDLFRDYYARSEERYQRAVQSITTTSQTVSFAERRSLATNSFAEDLAVLIIALRNIGIQNVLVVDLSKPTLGVPVVKVVVPGLAGYHDTSLRSLKRAKRVLEEMVQ